MENKPPTIGHRFLQASAAIAIAVALFYVVQMRVLPQPKTIEMLNREISRLKSANATLNEKLERLEARLSVLEKETALEKERNP